MQKTLLTSALLLLGATGFSQTKLTYKPSGEVLEKMEEAIADEKYDQAIKKGMKIHEGDTNYLDIQFQMAYAHFKNEDYDKCIELCSKHVKQHTNYTYIFYLYLGRSYLEKEQYDIAVDIFTSGIESFPKYSYLYKYRSDAYIKQKQSVEGIKDLQTALMLNPWDAELHKTYGELAENEGENAKALICYISHLMLEPGDNLKFLSEVNDKLTNGFDELPDGYEISTDDYSDLDKLIESQAAMDKSIKTSSKLTLPIVKHSQLIFTKLGERQPGDGFFDQFYLPFYKNLQLQSPKVRRNFDYLILISSENSKVVSKVRANIYAVNSYYKNTLMPLWREQHSVYTQDFNGKNQEVTYGWYNGTVSRIGRKENDEPVGYQEYYYTNGQPRAIGNWDNNGERTGNWTYFHLNGKVSGTETYEDGEIVGSDSSFYDNGQSRAVEKYEDGGEKSVIQRFNYYGVPTSTISYTGDDRDGPATFYNTFGTEEYSVNFIKGKLDGDYVEYYNNKQITEEVNFVDGNREGLSKRYYKNGQLKSEITYAKGLAEGPFKTYFSNGNLETEGEYKEGTLINTFKRYHINGTISSEAFYDEKGKKNGVYKEYDRAGKLNLELTFKKGEFSAYKVFHQDGSLIKEGSKKSGEFLFENFYSDGTRRAVGNYVGEEGKSGLWKFYDRNGVLDEEETYNNGLLNGKNISFYYNGKKHFTSNYADGELNGLYVRYYLNGQISRQGYSWEGDDQGLWLYYNSNGSVYAEKFFVNDELNGPQRYYDVDGKLSSVDYYDMGTLIYFELYDTTGNMYDRYDLVKDTMNVALHGIDGAVLREYTRVNGITHGDNVFYHGNGEVNSKGAYIEGAKHGKWTGNHANGKLRFTGEYFYGNEIGVWKYYDDKGNLETEATYVEGSLHGEKKWYVDGKLSTTKNYEYGSPHGDAYYYSDNGELQYVRKYYYGKVVAYSHPGTNGELVDFIPVENESCDCKAYFANGKVSREFTMNKGYFEGEYKEYYENGQLNAIRNYSGGDYNGQSITYYPTGKKKSEVTYVDDEMEGDLVYYHPNGKIAEVIPFKNGTRHGTYKKYNTAGKVIKTMNYYDGTIVK